MINVRMRVIILFIFNYNIFIFNYNENCKLVKKLRQKNNDCCQFFFIMIILINSIKRVRSMRDISVEETLSNQTTWQRSPIPFA